MDTSRRCYSYCKSRPVCILSLPMAALASKAAGYLSDVKLVGGCEKQIRHSLRCFDDQVHLKMKLLFVLLLVACLSWHSHSFPVSSEDADLEDFDAPDADLGFDDSASEDVMIETLNQPNAMDPEQAAENAEDATNEEVPDEDVCPAKQYKNSEGVCKACTQNEVSFENATTLESPKLKIDGLSFNAMKEFREVFDWKMINSHPLECLVLKGVQAGVAQNFVKAREFSRSMNELISSSMSFQCVCPPGFFRESRGGCSPCPSGRYSDAPNSRNCKACPAGTAVPTFSEAASSDFGHVQRLLKFCLSPGVECSFLDDEDLGALNEYSRRLRLAKEMSLGSSVYRCVPNPTNNQQTNKQPTQSKLNIRRPGTDLSDNCWIRRT